MKYYKCKKLGGNHTKMQDIYASLTLQQHAWWSSNNLSMTIKFDESYTFFLFIITNI